MLLMVYQVDVTPGACAFVCLNRQDHTIARRLHDDGKGDGEWSQSFTPDRLTIRRTQHAFRINELMFKISNYKASNGYASGCKAVALPLRELILNSGLRPRGRATYSY